MSRSPYVLAAIATAALPTVTIQAARALPSTEDEDIALVQTHDGVTLTVRAPRNAAAGARVEAELSFLEALRQRCDDDALNFAVPHPVGLTALPQGGRAIVHPELPGEAIDLEQVSIRSPLVRHLALALAAIHNIPTAVVDDAQLPTYSAEEFRHRKLVDIDRAAATGRVPFHLLRRWEATAEDITTWRYHPCVIHGELGVDQVRVLRGRVTAISDWGHAQASDPAVDLAWLKVGLEPAAWDALWSAYAAQRAVSPDPHTSRRAQFLGELAIARWLVYGMNTGQRDIVMNAQQMLTELTETP